MIITNVQISELKPYPKNAKTHPKKQIELLAKNISRFGFTTPLLIDKDNEIIAGHGRLEAVKTMGWVEVPCVRMDNLTPPEAKALRIADNKIAELGEWDMDLALPELQELEKDLQELTGFEPELLITSEERDDNIPEAPTETRTVLGDLYELGGHRVMCGDSTMIDQVEKLMNGEKADMVFTDPPYGMNLDTDYSKMPRGENKYRRVIGDEKDYDVMVLLNNIKADKYYIWGADWFYSTLPPGYSPIVWDKQPQNSVAGPQNHFELCWAYPKEKRRIIRKLWTGYTAKEKNESRVHPTQKPIEVCIDIIGKKGQLVADLFLGSGSTLIACEKTNRKCYGMELDPHYCDIVVQRYVDFTGNTKIKLNGKEVTWPKTENSRD